MLLDDRNVISSDARFVLGKVEKHPGNPMITEGYASGREYEMRFDNMQPNVWHDPAVNKWRAWYNSFSSCGGNLTGPNHDPLAPVDCQAFASHCPGSKHDPPVKIRIPAI